jgi:hypothetical protein
VQTNHSGSYRVVITNMANNTPGIPSQFASLVVLSDTDGDGMPDPWEILYSFNHQNGADAAGDADGDGLTNLEEYRAGTNPRDGQDFLRIESIESEMAVNGTTRVSFLAVSNRTYTVEYRDSLLPGAWTRHTDITAATTNRMVQLIDSPPAAVTKRYYRLATPRLP